MGCSKKKIKIVNPKEEDDEQGEDRISRLPDDLIRRILSMIDANYAVQTCLLSPRWKNVWKSLSHLNFNSYYFPQTRDFLKFVEQFLRHRDHQSDLSVFKLCHGGVIQQPVIQKLVTYGALHNLQHLNISYDVREVPPSVFTSQSLKQLYLTGYNWKLPKWPWNLPALTTLFLEGFSFQFFLNDDGTSKSLDLFSNLSNLKNLSLINWETGKLKVFYITAPQLEYLDIRLHSYLVYQGVFVISAPKLSSFIYSGHKPLRLSASDLNCLDKVHLNIHYHHTPNECRQEMFQGIINMFRQVRFAKFVTLYLPTIYNISWVLKLIENQRSPFCKMECLKIKGSYLREYEIVSTGVLTFLCNSSPTTTTIINESRLVFQGS